MKNLLCTVCLTLILSCIPFAMAMAADGIVKAGETLRERYDPDNGENGLAVIYKTPKGNSGEEGSATGDGFSYVTVRSFMGYTKWSYTKVRVTQDYGQYYLYTLTAIEDEESDKNEKRVEKKRKETTPTSWLDNPDEITAFYIVKGSIDPKAKFGKQEQGDACKAAFATKLPAGWKQAFTFSMSYDEKHTTDLKDGTLQMYIPAGYQKSGRKFAVMAIDKYGEVHIYYDSDLQDGLLTAKLGFEGYAFNLIYMD